MGCKMTRDKKINKKIKKRMRIKTVKEEPKKNRKFLKRMNRKTERIVICSFIAILIISLIVPFSTMGIVGRKIAFLGNTIGFTFICTVMFILGVIILFGKNDKDMNIVKNILLKIISALIAICSLVVFIEYVVSYYKDIPKVFTSDYSICTGKLSNFYVNNGKYTSTDFVISENKFKVDGKFKSGFLVEGRKYRVEYLPNTKYVMNMYSYNS